MEGREGLQCYEPGKRDRLLLGREREREGERDNHPETGLPRKARNTRSPPAAKPSFKNSPHNPILRAVHLTTEEKTPNWLS